MELGAYLQKHFVDRPTFAVLAGVSPERLAALTAAGAVPAATYVCDGHSIHSSAFGVIETNEAASGEFFRPECAHWTRIAANAPAGTERAAVESALAGELRAALAALDLPVAAVEAKIQAFLPHFWNGTFGLCVADPATGAGIVRKEILQERLTRLTDNGRNAAPAEVSPTELLALIDDYARSAMPFSPAEYPRSSRKRLVDDLRARVGGG